MDDEKRQFFWRIRQNEMWGATGWIEGKQVSYHFVVFDEIIRSKAPHVIIERPWRPLIVMEDGSPVPGRHVIVSDEVLGLIKTWQIAPFIGGFSRLSDMLDSCYD